MPHQLEVPTLPIHTRRFTPVQRKLHVRRLTWVSSTPFAVEPATFVLDRPLHSPFYGIVGRGRFTPRQQMNYDRAERAIGVGERVSVSTFPAAEAGKVAPAAGALGLRSGRCRASLDLPATGQSAVRTDA